MPLPLTLEPLDLLFSRDGRPFGPATRALGGLPTPQTLLGALRTALLERHARLERLHGRRFATWDEVCEAAAAPAWLRGVAVRGPWLARMVAGRPEVLVPVPAVLHADKAGAKHGGAARHLCRLRPGPADLAGWRPQEPGLRPLWLDAAEPTEPARGLLTPAGLTRFLAGGTPEPDQVVPAAALFAPDHRTGVAINPDRLVAEESQLFGTTFVALRPPYSFREDRDKPPAPEVVLYAEALGLSADHLAGIPTLALGGEGRRVAVRTWDTSALPAPVPPGPRAKPLLLLTTPGLFASPRWRPAPLAGRLAAAAVPGYVAVSGWDLARGGPKPTRFAAPAGSVYFLDGDLPALPADALADDAADRAAGWGHYLKGVWNDA